MSVGPTRGGRGRRAFGARAPKVPEEPASTDAARSRAIGMLSRRDYPRGALKLRLTDAGFFEPAAEEAVASLEDERLVNDARYVEGAVSARIGRGFGPIRIRIELQRLGLASALIEAAIDAASPVWSERAIALRVRRFGPQAPADLKERARQVRLLLSRGFSGGHVRDAMGAAGRHLDVDLDVDLDGDLDEADLTESD
jgi:regulatory protein